MLLTTVKHEPTLSTALLSDEEIERLIDTSPRVDKATYICGLDGKPNVGSVARVAPNAVVKCSPSSGMHELLSAELVRKYTVIPVPMHERVFYSSFRTRVVQQFVPGRVLMDAWPHLGWWMRLRVAITLRFYIRELRSISSRGSPPPFPGPPSEDGNPQPCTGRLFTNDGSGPFRAYREMSRWYQNRLLVMQRFRKEGMGCAPFDDSKPLVFTHMDLHPRNAILGCDNQLWIVDWANAGWYPEWFEGASMKLFVQHRTDIPSSWTAWIPFIAGSCEKPGQLPFIRAISYSLDVLKAEIMNLVSCNVES